MFSLSRRVSLFLLGLALVALWQVLKLDAWGREGPGPGLFPQVLVGLCILLSLFELITPAATDSSASADQEIDPGFHAADSTAKRTFFMYAISILIMVVGAYFAGFAVTAFALTVFILHFSEHISLSRAVGTGVIFVIAGWIAFAWLLRVNLPEGPLDSAFLALVY